MLSSGSFDISQSSPAPMPRLEALPFFVHRGVRKKGAPMHRIGWGCTGGRWGSSMLGVLRQTIGLTQTPTGTPSLEECQLDECLSCECCQRAALGLPSSSSLRAFVGACGTNIAPSTAAALAINFWKAFSGIPSWSATLKHA